MDELQAQELIARRHRYAEKLRSRRDISLSLHTQFRLDAFTRRFASAMQNSLPSTRLEPLYIIVKDLRPDLSNAEFFGHELQSTASIPYDIRVSLQGMASQAHKGGFVSRQRFEAVHRLERQGWYGLFDTLTLNDAHLDLSNLNDRLPLDVQLRTLRGEMWNRYRLDLAYQTFCCTYGCNPVEFRKRHGYRPPQSDYFSCSAVVEIGKKDRAHVHVVAFMKAVPLSWKRDPNGGLGRPKNMELGAAKLLWPLGISSPRPIRHSSGDAWGRLGWKWPQKLGKDGKTWRPLPRNPPEACGGYIGKYLSGSDPRLLGFRTRMTRGVGLHILCEVVARLPRSILRKLDRPWQTAKSEKWPEHVRKFPRRLLRLAIRRERLRRVDRHGKRRLFALFKMLTILKPEPVGFLTQIQRLRIDHGCTHFTQATLPTAIVKHLCTDVPEEYYMLMQEFPAGQKGGSGIPRW